MNRYRWIQIQRPRAFKLFCRTLINNPAIAREIQVLSFHITHVLPTEEDRVEVQDVLKILTSLTQVKEIFINFPFLSTIVASKTAALTSLPNLKTLTLKDAFIHRGKMKPEYFQQILLYPSLQSLTFHTDVYLTHNLPKCEQWWSSNYRADGEIMKLDEDLLVSRNQNFISVDGVRVRIDPIISDLRFSGRFLDFEIFEIISQFSDLKSLYIEDWNHTNHDINVLEKVSNPSQLQELHLQLHLPYGAAYRVPLTPVNNLNIYSSILPFTSLKVLQVPNHGFNIELFQFIRDPLPLHTLIFSRNTPVAISDIKALLLPGSHRLTTLKTLQLDVVFGTVDSHCVEIDGLYLEYDSVVPQAHPGWIRPEWSIQFSEVGLLDLIEVAKSVRVEVIGSAVQAIGVVGAYEKEMIAVRKEYVLRLTEIWEEERLLREIELERGREQLEQVQVGSTNEQDS